MTFYDVIEQYDIKLSEEQELEFLKDMNAVLKYDFVEGLNDLLNKYMVPASSNQNAVFYTFLRDFTKFVKNY